MRWRIEVQADHIGGLLAETEGCYSEGAGDWFDVEIVPAAGLGITRERIGIECLLPLWVILAEVV